MPAPLHERRRGVAPCKRVLATVRETAMAMVEQAQRPSVPLARAARTVASLMVSQSKCPWCQSSVAQIHSL